MLKIGDRVVVEKGCRARKVDSRTIARVHAIRELGAEYGHNVKVLLNFRTGSHAGTTLAFYARHPNRLGDDLINLNDGQPEHKIQIRVVHI